MILRQVTLCGILLLGALPSSVQASHPFLSKTETATILGHHRPQLNPLSSPKAFHGNQQHVTSLTRGGASSQSTAPTNTAVAVQSAISVALTSLGLYGILYTGQHPTITQWATKIGLPTSWGGLPPLLYVAFWILTFAASAVTKLAAGGVSVSTQQSLLPTETPSPQWYASLKKPSWNPPGWLFPIMWLLISKPTQFLALRQVFLASSSSSSIQTSTILPLSIYCVHLALGNTWNDVFFGFQRVGLGLAVIGLFWATLVATAISFYQITPAAGYWILPTLGWVTVASTLNWSIYELNKKDNKKLGRK